MLMGIKFQAKPTNEQAKVLCSWMGSAKTVWNSKCQEDKYLRKFAHKYLPIGTFPKINATYSQYKDKELTPWLFECPSQILRNSVANWYFSYREFFKQQDRGRPQAKKKGRGMSIYLTNELFQFMKDKQGIKLFIGTKTNNIGMLDVNWHNLDWKKYGFPKSITIKKLPAGEFTVSFCYGEAESGNAEQRDREEWFSHLKTLSAVELNEKVIGLDRGVNIAVATEKGSFNPTEKDKRGIRRHQNRLKRQQKKLAKQKDKKSKRREKQRIKIAKTHKKIANIRENACHHISRPMVSLVAKVFVLEDLKIKNMTKSAKGTKKKPGNKVRQKSGLNREILNVSWHMLEKQLKYKARHANKIVLKISPYQTSQECADCGHTHHSNRNGSDFKCMLCGNTDHADTNAAKVIKKRAINLILNSGTELSDKGVLNLKSDIGHGAKLRPSEKVSKKAQAKNVETQRKCQKRRTVA